MSAILSSINYHISRFVPVKLPEHAAISFVLLKPLCRGGNTSSTLLRRLAQPPPRRNNGNCKPDGAPGERRELVGGQERRMRSCSQHRVCVVEQFAAIITPFSNCRVRCLSISKTNSFDLDCHDCRQVLIGKATSRLHHPVRVWSFPRWGVQITSPITGRRWASGMK
jgi:hypothetical protein